MLSGFDDDGALVALCAMMAARTRAASVASSSSSCFSRSPIEAKGVV